MAPRIERSASTFAGRLLMVYSEVAMVRTAHCPIRNSSISEHKANRKMNCAEAVKVADYVVESLRKPVPYPGYDRRLLSDHDVLVSFLENRRGFCLIR